MSILEIPCKNTFVHFPLSLRPTLKANRRRGTSCDTSSRGANLEPQQAFELDGSRSPCLPDFAEKTLQLEARIRGSARWRSARHRSGRKTCQKPTSCQSCDASDVETAVPSPDASPCPSSAGSPLQTPSPTFMLRVPSLPELFVTLQNASGNVVADREGSYAAHQEPSLLLCSMRNPTLMHNEQQASDLVFDHGSFDLVLQTPSPVWPSWQPASAHALTLQSAAAVDANADSCDETSSIFSDDSDDLFGCSCQCGDGRRAHVPFSSFLGFGPDEIDEDFCPSCCRQNSNSHAPSTCSSPEPARRNLCAMYDSPGEAFWR